MALSDSTVVVEVTTLLLEDNIQVKTVRTVMDGETVLSVTSHYTLYGRDKKEQFLAEVDGAAQYVAILGW